MKGVCKAIACLLLFALCLCVPLVNAEAAETHEGRAATVMQLDEVIPFSVATALDAAYPKWRSDTELCSQLNAAYRTPIDAKAAVKNERSRAKVLIKSRDAENYVAVRMLRRVRGCSGGRCS